ncbi:DNA-binding protein D-ETS-4-like [Ctenocephalides felis]|uniref:DNA-binding protein D-ETS-4-like n=1 Tax=Ctenocephalides felis TaxID=7515 RepID=UPI000E6E4E82|nr:DNA-binding protein D-ETS-4-like [Ctenocephalides felis]
MVLGKNHYAASAQTVPCGNESPDYHSFAASFDLSLLPSEEYADGEVPCSPRFRQPQFNREFYDSATAANATAADVKKIEADVYSGYEFDTPPRSEYGDNEFVPVTILRYAPTNTESASVMSPPLLPPSPLSSCSSAPASPACSSPANSAIMSPDLSLVKMESNAYDARDHETLRGALEDTSFQRRLNLRPLSLEALWPSTGKQDRDEIAQEELDGNMDFLHMDLDFDGLEQLDVEEDLRPVLSMALEQVKKDVMATCSLLNISPDPCAWSVEQSRSWLKWTAAQFSLPAPCESNFNEDGSALTQLPEHVFVAREPQSGSILYAQLEIWKAARLEQCLQCGSEAEDEEPPSLTMPCDTDDVLDTANFLVGLHPRLHLLPTETVPVLKDKF